MIRGEFGGAGWSEDAALGGRLRPFSRDGCVYWSEDGERAEVFVGNTLIGTFERRAPQARNVILIGLCQGQRVRVGRLARAFDITAETLRKVRRLYEREGLAGLVGGKSRGREPKLNGGTARAVHRWFAQGVSVREVQEKLKARRVPVLVSVGTLSNERARWKAALLTRTGEAAAMVDEDPPSEPPEGLSQGEAQRVLPECVAPAEPALLKLAQSCAAIDVSGEAPPRSMCQFSG